MMLRSRVNEEVDATGGDATSCNLTRDTDVVTQATHAPCWTANPKWLLGMRACGSCNLSSSCRARSYNGPAVCQVNNLKCWAVVWSSVLKRSIV